MIEEKLFAVFELSSHTSALAELSVSLLESQKKTWPQLTAGYASLDSIRLREIACQGYSVWLQYNPGRIVSTGAKVDARSIQERRCFLCVQNLPETQKGILYKKEFLVLCNPAPIFREHFTISHVEHIPQLFANSALCCLELARDLSPRLTVFYNGPKCGASAPDHMHFQACPSGAIPVERAACENNRRNARKSINNVQILTLEGFGREVVVLESQDIVNLENVLRQLIGSLAAVTGTTEEPLMNLLCSYADSAWRVILFPRSKHRPDAYFKEGDDRILISPAAVDIGGLIITPIEKDFNVLEASIIEGVFSEVSLAKELVDAAIEKLS
ncbi:MAG: DUF4922 domain-containing protein [Ignavibacteriales bacterium]|nr:DUF4922 domain-containing protein [Ignavibacteriales bacterium]